MIYGLFNILIQTIDVDKLDEEQKDNTVSVEIEGLTVTIVLLQYRIIAVQCCWECEISVSYMYIRAQEFYGD